MEYLKKKSADKPEHLKILQLTRTPGSEQVARMPSPRFIRTHLPLSFLPPDVILNVLLIGTTWTLELVWLLASDLDYSTAAKNPLSARATFLEQDLPATVQRVANFLGKEYRADQLAELCTHLKFENFKKNPSVGIDGMKEYGIMAPEGEFVRKGKSGNWRHYFDEDMTREAQLWIDKNLQDTDMQFPSMQ
ncbi:Sulfotransferase family cytosolic 1B member 1 [Papilio machaon]|uniref:Sulfotransferase family cytosolic 1B member 1 n=1 Tax=Papilio machaon TaxID=76193 RepID=A0A194QLM6_PAPMA|nr:Sulfotransferase family cytosolic 1B member 1 [Papilio machaon]